MESFNLIPEGSVTNLFSKLLHEYKVYDLLHHLFKIAYYQTQVVVVETQKKSPVRCLLNAETLRNHESNQNPENIHFDIIR